MIDFVELQKKQARLDEIAAELKQELFGIDNIIDRVIELVRVWYMMPELITRPVIVNLWGMTGVGKTQLVRRLSQKLGFNDRFVEIQMDGFTNSSNFLPGTISEVLRKSSIVEGHPGIVLLDEFQRFRTVGQDGSDESPNRFQDVWMLLSDGRFSLNSEVFLEIEMMLAMRDYDKESEKENANPNPLVRGKKRKEKEQQQKYVSRFKIWPYEAKNLKQKLHRSESINEIMTWDEEKIQTALIEFQNTYKDVQSDYSKMLVFISGNLDEMYRNASSVDDADTDADIYYQETIRLIPSDVKQALSQRFRPEQISRMGSNHIIYPSLQRATYEKIIHRTCQTYITEMNHLTQGALTIHLEPSVYEEIYNNSVYPTQGTRPVFSAIHQILGSALSKVAMWGLENRLEHVYCTIDGINQYFQAVSRTGGKYEVPVLLELNNVRKKNTDDFLMLVAVHEIGHALTYAAQFRIAPREVKINMASLTGGYMIEQHQTMVTKQEYLQKMIVLVAGSMAEKIVFGEPLRSNGNSPDYKKATELASTYVRRMAFGETKSFVLSEQESTDHNTDMESGNPIIEKMMIEAENGAIKIIKQHKNLFRTLVNVLYKNKRIGPEQFREIVKHDLPIGEAESLDEASLNPYVKLWQQYQRD